MLIGFTVENWMSFREKAHFSMIASLEKQHKNRLSYIKKYKMRLLPISAIYGGNASGKTNLFKALNFAQRFIVKGTTPNELIDVQPFCLDSQSNDVPVSFKFELLVNDQIYELSFSLTRNAVVEEKLIHIVGSNEKILYHRRGSEWEGESVIKKDKALFYAFQQARSNQLFLTNSVFQQIDAYKFIYEWFENSLTLIAPDARFSPIEQFMHIDNPLHEMSNVMLRDLDTGIQRLGEKEVPFESVSLPTTLKKQLPEYLKEGVIARATSSTGEGYIFLRGEKGNIVAKKLVSFHSKDDGTEVEFEMLQESDGSRRIIDLLPAFLELSEKDCKKVFVIDEIDRSLHALVIRQLIEGYLTSCSEGCRTQLLFTTHNLLLMDQGLLRRDEMWVTERLANGRTSLTPFSDFKDIRNDKDIRKSYLQGRLGGIPHILYSNPSRVQKRCEKSSPMVDKMK